MSARADRQARRCPARILALPDDILVLIFQCLKFRRVYALSATCKQLLSIEAEHQEDLWHRLASARYPARSLGRIDGSRVWAKAKWTRATWKQRFLYLMARRSTTRVAMADWLNGAFKFRVELISADGLRATSDEDEMRFPNKRHDNLAAMQCLFASSAGANFYPTKIELHARRKADGRSFLLTQVETSLDSMSEEDKANTSVVFNSTDDAAPWAEEPMELNVSLYREEGWVRPTRSKPQPKFTWWGAQLTWDGAVQGWWGDYSLVGSLFVALQSEHLFTVA
jgi:hypothetical protein